jgi:putative ABC transport system permease protein
MIRSLAHLLDTDPGFRAERIVTAQVALPDTRYGDDSQRVGFYDALIERLQNSPGIEAAAIGWAFPFSDQVRDSAPFDRPGQAPPAGPQAPEQHAEFRIVSADYFRTMNIPLVAGRTFSDADLAGSPLVVLIDEFLAERHFRGEDPVGRQLRQFRGPATIVGVVGRVDHSEVGEAPKEVIYYHHRQLAPPWTGLAARAAMDPSAAVELMRVAVRELDPELPLYDVATMEQRVQRSLGDRRLALGALGAFAAIALLLAVLGVYGVMRYSAAQRLREIGVRVALGAKPEQILRMVLRQGLAITGLGIVIGLAAALVATRSMEGLLYGVDPRDPVTFAAVPVLLVFVALLACYVPARRAARADPMSVLRAE